MLRQLVFITVLILALLQFVQANELKERNSKIYKLSKTCCPGCSYAPAKCCCAPGKAKKTVYTTVVVTSTEVAKKAGKTKRQGVMPKMQERQQVVEPAHLCKPCPSGAKLASRDDLFDRSNSVSYCCINKSKGTTTITRTSTTTVTRTTTGAATSTTTGPVLTETFSATYTITGLNCASGADIAGAQTDSLTTTCDTGCDVVSSSVATCSGNIITVTSILQGVDAQTVACDTVSDITQNGVSSSLALAVGASASVTITNIIGDADPICLIK